MQQRKYPNNTLYCCVMALQLYFIIIVYFYLFYQENQGKTNLEIMEIVFN